MPATHLIRVDLPAPLSLTSAITSPSRTSKSTSVSAWTEPNDLEIARSSSSGVSFTVAAFLPQCRVEAPAKAPPPRLTARLLAELRELPDADVALLEELVREEPRVVGLRDRDHGDRQRGFLLGAVLPEPVGLWLLAVEQRNRCRRRGLGLGRHVLVDGHRLPAGDDVLDALNSRVLPRQRDGLEPFGLQGRDDRARDVVVRRNDAVDLVV